MSRLKEQVRDYWNRESCGSSTATSAKFSRAYFEEIEQHRYSAEPEILSFAQFSRFRGQNVLEVGVGAGTDFIQWVRSGALAYGVDLTESAIEHTKRRLAVYGLSAEGLCVADAESLPYPDNFFDLSYSWGVLHHTPDTEKALREIIRVTRVGGLVKLMVYNRRSLYSLYRYVHDNFLRGHPFRGVSWVFYHRQESKGTKTYTRREVKAMLSRYPVRVLEIWSAVTGYELLKDKALPFRFAAYLLACLFGFHKAGWFMTIELEKE